MSTSSSVAAPSNTASSACSVDCLAARWDYTPDNDITGAGVVISYVAASALGILVIIMYYVTLFDPSSDPFERVQQYGTLPHQRNQWDEIVLKWVRFGPAHLSQRFLGRPSIMSDATQKGIENILVKNIVLIADLQIVTGLAILVSGYIQLQCGLASFKWRIFLDLAWFSSLTHLSCLTVLRCHLHTHDLERTWRLLAMGSLAALLAAGRIMTADDVWSWDMNRATPAICLILRPEAFAYKKGDSRWLKSSNASLYCTAPPILSAVFILVAFLCRVVKLHKSLSQVGNRVIKWLDCWTQSLLWKLFGALCTEGDTSTLKRSLVYRPVFCVVMLVQIAWILWKSMAIEVGWIIAAFGWGILCIYEDLSGDLEHLTFGKQAWTFGQVVAVLTLLAPVISIFGTWEQISRNHTVQSAAPRQTPQSHRSPGLPGLPVNSAPSVPSKDLERPDADRSSRASCLISVVMFTYAVCILIAVRSYVGNAIHCDHLSHSQPKNLSSVFYSFSMIAPGATGAVFCVAYCSITIEQATSRGPRWLRTSLQSLACFMYILALFLTCLWDDEDRLFRLFLYGIGLPFVALMIHKAITLWRN